MRAPAIRSVVLTFALIVAALVTVDAQANTYYVAATGSNAAAGTIAAPWQTLSYAVAQLNAGDTLYIRAGTYTGVANIIDSALSTVRAGTSWANPITIAGYAGEAVVLQPPDQHFGIALRTDGHEAYLIFQDFTIDMINDSNGAWGGDGVYLSSGANHNRFLRLEVKNAMVNGIGFAVAAANSPFNEIVNCSIHDNGRLAGVNQGYGIYAATSDNLYDGNQVYNNGGYGIVIYNDRNTIRNNNIHGNGTHGGTNYGIDIGAEIASSSASNLVYNNLIYGNNGGISVYTNSSNTMVYNNTIYNNARGIDIQYATGAIIENDIVYGNASAITNYAGPATIDHNLMTDPAFVNAAAGDFHLQPTSPAIGAGITISAVPMDYDGNPRPSGAYDIGAYEYAAVPPAPKNVRIVSP